MNQSIATPSNLCSPCADGQLLVGCGPPSVSRKRKSPTCTSARTHNHKPSATPSSAGGLASFRKHYHQRWSSLLLRPAAAIARVPAAQSRARARVEWRGGSVPEVRAIDPQRRYAQHIPRRLHLNRGGVEMTRQSRRRRGHFRRSSHRRTRQCYGQARQAWPDRPPTKVDAGRPRREQLNLQGHSRKLASLSLRDMRLLWATPRFPCCRDARFALSPSRPLYDSRLQVRQGQGESLARHECAA